MSNQYKCLECELTYTLSDARIKQDLPQHESFVCDLCEGESND
jgi:hypothetical protein